MRKKIEFRKSKLFFLVITTVGIMLISMAFTIPTALAQSPIHPTFPFLDEDGENVLISGKPVSTILTCGQCHDTAFIEEHSFHVDVGFSELSAPGETPSERPWDISPGLYGRWNPITYRYLSPQGDELIDITLVEWIRTIGLRHVGGGPAESEGVEMNCFLCHLDNPNNQSRIESIQSGNFEWANTATLADTGIVSQRGLTWQWNTAAFTEEGEIEVEYITIQDPDNENCGQCHGLVQDDLEEPLISEGCISDSWTTQTTGQIISPQRLSDSAMNLADKEDLSRSWDIHAERLLACTDCHFSLNNPANAFGGGADSLEHLAYDPRGLEIGEYLYQPLHQFARGQSAQSLVSPDLKDSMRRCESCHETETTHAWLPYQERHMSAVNCETCHIPKIYSNAIQQFDWTVVSIDGNGQSVCRGIKGDTGTAKDLVTGFTPVLMQRQNIDGEVKLTPYNLITSWFWVYGNPERPVRLEDLQSAWFDGNAYRPEIIELFDNNGNGSLEKYELIIDSQEKETLIRSNLIALGLDDPRIVGEIQPYNINHDVANGEWVTRECETCHSEDSRITQPIMLASYVPGGVAPEFVKDTNTLNDGEIYVDEDGALFYQPFPQDQGLYILGHDNVSWVDWFGVGFFIVVLLSVVSHGGLRVWVSKKSPKTGQEIKRMYMYTFYERLWHWLQTFAITLLAITGMIIHKPDMFGLFSFRGVVLVHNILAAILAANAVLALFYNLISGDVKRFIPQPQGFFNQAVIQTKFYLKGMFSGEEHPFEKTREKRLNPLQKITYFGILNILLPLQGITGILIWGAQRWPKIADSLGGLSFLAPFHTLIAWLFISFIAAHIYLITTGHSPLVGIKSMINGWDEVEVQSKTESEED